MCVNTALEAIAMPCPNIGMHSPAPHSRRSLRALGHLQLQQGGEAGGKQAHCSLASSCIY